MKTVFLFVVEIYQKLFSPSLFLFFGQTNFGCRFYPTCSDYMKAAINRYGIWRGVWLGIKRLVRCHPFNQGGLDFVQ